MIDGLIISLFAFLIYTEAWGPLLLPNRRPKELKVSVHDHAAGISEPLWKSILVLVTDHWFFNWLGDQLRLPENKNTKIMLNQNIVKEIGPVQIEKIQKEKTPVSKLDKHNFNQVC